jgi:glycerol-3-phosphate dehydrogenase (NAD(P)+)
MKNVIAIAAGVCHGLQLGQNAVAALITRGLAEMTRLAVALGAQPQTLAGLAGLGDLVLTCTGELSRNRGIGVELAHGRSLDQITFGLRTVAEGIRSTGSVVKLGLREGVPLPISEQMHAVLHGERSPREAIRILMDRSLGGE